MNGENNNLGKSIVSVYFQKKFSLRITWLKVAQKKALLWLI